MTANTAPAAKKSAATPCECSKYEAVISAQLTEENLADGSYEEFTTGCTATTKNTFAPGHDAKLKSALIRWGADQGMSISRLAGGMRTTADAQHWADMHGFGTMVAAGIKKAQEKAAAKAARAAKKAAPKAERKLAEKAGVVAPKAAPLADIVAAEEAKHAAEQAASRPAPEWDDADEIVAPPEASAEYMALAAADEPKAAVDLTGRREVVAKVGRWEYKGVVDDAGVLHYLAKDGHTRKTAEAGKFSVVRDI